MSVLVVGLNHKGAPLATLERVALTGDALGKLLHDVYGAEDIAGALVLSTCNRVEIYAEVGKFHGAVASICELLARHSHVPQGELTPHLYVHYENRAVQHLLAVACGLDSMVIGESQILGQLRQALRLARDQGTLGRTLSELGSVALRTGKRAHTETAVGRAGASLVSVGLQSAAVHLGNGAPAGKNVLVVGAGSMSGLVAASVANAGPADLVVASRTRQRAERLAASAGGRAGQMSELAALMAAADLVVTCTGAPGHVITVDLVQEALRQRSEGALVLLDLAMPRDVEPAVAEIPGVELIDLDTLSADGIAGAMPGSSDIDQVHRIMTEELASHVSASRAATVAPTVVALRTKAARVVEAELARLAGRLADLDAASMEEISRSMRRVTDKLLHDPTVRVKELADAPGADSYEDALRVLFDLDPATVQAVAQADVQLAGWPREEAE
ncbi:MAG TPA: glutamyl-tRNA reductase [Streptosporangiaceae bacterium]|jgi:glutamyl-tRNA reductase